MSVDASTGIQGVDSQRMNATTNTFVKGVGKERRTREAHLYHRKALRK
jgi:hypothetical protein